MRSISLTDTGVSRSLQARWYLKKASRSAMARVGRGRGQSLNSEARHECARVLTYHRIGDSRFDPFCVSRSMFGEQMALLAEEQRAVSLADLQMFLEGTTTLPENACLVTIDDGMRSTLSDALPILERWSIPAVAFVSSKLIGLNSPDLVEPYLSKVQLRELNASNLISIGSHAHTHRSMGELELDNMRQEAAVSKDILSDAIGEEVISFAYPFGMQRDFSEQTDAVLAQSGYEIAFNSMHGPVMPGMRPISLPRIKVEGGESLKMFRKISLGALDKWRIVDDNLWRLQRVRQEIS